MPPDDPEDGQQSGIGKYKVWLIIGVIVIGAIIAGVMLNRPAPEPSNGPTLHSLQTELNAVKVNVAGFTDNSATVATHTEDIADIENDLETIQTQLNGFNSSDPELAPAIADLQDQIDDILITIGLIRTEELYVSRVEDDYVDITIVKEGTYPIAVTLYGESLTDVEARFPSLYTVVGVWGSNTTMTAIVAPVGQWLVFDVVELRADGVVDYSTAMVAKGQGEGEEGW